MNALIKLVPNHNSYKIGINEIIGLRDAMQKLVKPIQDLIQNKAYWTNAIFEPSEYKSRDGFIPYSHNCGGLDLTLIVPNCESHGFGFLQFGECDECTSEKQCGYKGTECGYESEGHLDAKLRIWFKFEGVEDGKLAFYLYCGGGNDDAPYYRTKHEITVFEASFECNSVSGLNRAASKHIKALMKVLK